jgi:hypothetical protein
MDHVPGHADPAAAFDQSDLPPALQTEVLFDDVDFVTNDELTSVLGAASATPEQVEAAVGINRTHRMRS